MALSAQRNKALPSSAPCGGAAILHRPAWPPSCRLSRPRCPLLPVRPLTGIVPTPPSRIDRPVRPLAWSSAVEERPHRQHPRREAAPRRAEDVDDLARLGCRPVGAQAMPRFWMARGLGLVMTARASGTPPRRQRIVTPGPAARRVAPVAVHGAQAVAAGGRVLQASTGPMTVRAPAARPIGSRPERANAGMTGRRALSRTSSAA